MVDSTMVYACLLLCFMLFCGFKHGSSMLQPWFILVNDGEEQLAATMVSVVDGHFCSKTSDG